MEGESLEARIARIDERTELMLQKLDDHCHWKAEASGDLKVLKKADLPKRVTELEKWRWYILGASAVAAMLLTIFGKNIRL